MKNIIYWICCIIFTIIVIKAASFCYLIVVAITFQEAPIWVLVSNVVVFVCLIIPLSYAYNQLFTNILKIIKDEKTQKSTEEKEKV